jgi:hypothetical protein
MERNEELSTRDLASPNDSTAGTVTTSENEAAVGEESGQAPVQDYDRAASRDYDQAPAQDHDQAAAPSATGTAAPESEQVRSAAPETEQVGTSTPGSEQVQAPASSAGTAGSASDVNEPLLATELTETFQRRWEEVQTRFVDEPRGAVEDADGLVAKLMQQLAEGFAQERERLEAQWGRGEDISTEDLRVALQRYRSFFQRLLST